MPFSLLLDLMECHRQYEGIARPKREFSIDEVTSELLPAYQDVAAIRNQQFHVEIEPDIVLMINKDSFRQLVTILLDNAVKYTPDNGSISLTLSKRGKHIQITQENTCDPSLEIDPERLFERFYRGDSARTQSAEFSGYGIGLSAARAICEKFNGKMTAEYASAESIRFIVSF
jgi:two-component system sensor histidine kinase CiaH